MTQYKNHPVIEALNVIAPVITPSFELVSIRDYGDQVFENPILSYVIASIVNKVLDKPTMKFRTTYSVILDLSIFETDTPLDWCKYEEIKDAQDRQALFYRLESLIQDIIVMFVQPSRASEDIQDEDAIYSKYQFIYEGFIDGLYYKRKGKQRMTGAIIEFNISCLTEENQICCVDDKSKEIAEKMKAIVSEDSVSYRRLQKRIDG
jgi:hypothetical protein